MSFPPAPEEPYQPIEYSIDDPRETRRPGALTTICVIAIILASLVLLFGLASIATLAVGPQSPPPIPRNTPQQMREMMESQNRMNEQINAVSFKYASYTIVMLLLQIIIALGLLFGGIKSLGLHEAGRCILLWVFGVAILVDLVATGLQLFIQVDVATALNSGMADVMRTLPSGRDSEAAKQIMQGTMTAGIFMGAGGVVAIALVKLVYYIVSIRYLRKPEIVALFQSSQQPTYDSN